MNPTDPDPQHCLLDRPEGEDEGDEGEGALTPRQRLQASVHLHAAARVSLLIRKESIPVIRVPAPLFRKRCGSESSLKETPIGSRSVLNCSKKESKHCLFCCL